LNKLIALFKAKSLVHLIKIFLVFGLAGSFSVIMSNPTLKFIKLDQFITSYPLYFLIKLIIIFPLYQITLFAFALIFGEFDYFKKFFKKFFNYFLFK
tara:strand:- start:346 stop:636 length:291 start_codon:yes stop_codon:yes gene_type:complete